jgi:hypothetical protein
LSWRDSGDPRLRINIPEGHIVFCRGTDWFVISVQDNAALVIELVKAVGEVDGSDVGDWHGCFLSFAEGLQIQNKA